MLARLFSDISLAAMLRAFIIALILAVVLAYALPSYTLPLGLWLVKPTAILGGIICCIGLLFCAWLFQNNLMQSGFLKPSYLVMVCTAGYLAFFSSFYGSLSFLIPAIMLSYCFGRLLHLSYTPIPYWLLTEIGLIIGVGLYLDRHFTFLFPIIWMATIFYGGFSLRTLIIPLFAAFISIFMIVCYYWLVLDVLKFPPLEWSFHAFSELNFQRLALLLAPLLIGVVLSLGDVISSLNKGNVSKRQSMGFMLCSMLLCLLPISLSNDPKLIGLMMAFPLAVFQANYLYYQRKWWLRDLVLIAPWASMALLIYTKA